MHNGRKGAAEKIFFNTLRELNRYNQKEEGATFFYQVLECLKPTLGTSIRRVGRNYYNVPVPLRAPQQYKLAFQ